MCAWVCFVCSQQSLTLSQMSSAHQWHFTFRPILDCTLFPSEWEPIKWPTYHYHLSLKGLCQWLMTLCFPSPQPHLLCHVHCVVLLWGTEVTFFVHYSFKGQGCVTISSSMLGMLQGLWIYVLNMSYVHMSKQEAVSLEPHLTDYLCEYQWQNTVHCWIWKEKIIFYRSQ